MSEFLEPGVQLAPAGQVSTFVNLQIAGFRAVSLPGQREQAAGTGCPLRTATVFTGSHTGLAVRAQIVADKPTVQPEQQQQPDIKSSTAEPPSTSGCPFLAAVNPPEVRIPWHTRLQQLTKPYEFQQLLLDDALKKGHKMVSIDKTVGFSDAYMPASGDAVKAVFAGEAGTDPIIQQPSIPSMGEQVGPPLGTASSVTHATALDRGTRVHV